MDSTRQVIRKLLCEAAPQHYTDIGHYRSGSKDFDAWKWSDGQFSFASQEGVDPDTYHLDVGMEGPPQFAGRIDVTKRMASLTPWAFEQRMAARKANHVAKRLAEHLPDDFEIWYFPWGELDRGGTGRRLR
ncbi:hypothetical protein LCGC14_0163380 [marine sediment metagenome]|uniref:Uncharacterized protein n=1 Tax=marine sediment metagenome TaxID=412755 RepID=A0A0F9UY90_9ZZZZ